MTVALEVMGAYKTFREEDQEQVLPWYRLLRKKERKLVTAVDRVSFAVRRGEIYGILGPNGSGKSTLIRLISTLLIPDGGKLTVFGQDVSANRQAVRRLINRVSVDAAFFKKLSAVENLNYAARLYGMNMGEARRRAAEIMSRMGLERSKWNSPLENLSRGQQQKVAVARALMTDPALLLLDEPTTGLDPKSKRDVQDFVLEIREKRETTVILTSHDMDEAERMCNRIAFIVDGRFVAEGTAAGLKAQYGSVSLEEVFFAVTGKKMIAEEVAE